jgi:hypothetical protein
MSCQLAFGMQLFGSGAVTAPSTALSASLSAFVPAPPLPPVLQSYASLANAASSFGVDLSQSGAIESLAASASAVANLSIPAVAMAPGGLLGPIALLSALANIVAGLGLNPFAPGFSQASLAFGAGLSAFDDLVIPASFSAGDASSAGLSSLVGLELEAMAQLDVSVLSSFQAPDLGPLTALASFSSSCSAAGFPVASSEACGAACPMSF